MYRKKRRILLPSGVIFLFCVAIFGFIFWSIHQKERYSVENIDSLKRRLEEHPEDIKATLNLATLYLKKASDGKNLKFLDKSIALYRRAIAMDRGAKYSDRIYHPLGVAYFKKASALGGYFWEEAEHFFLKAISEGKELSSSHAYLGAIHRMRKDYDKALHHYRLAFLHGKEKPENIFNLAWAYKDKKMYEEAKALFARLQNAQIPLPMRVDLHTALALIYYEQKLLEDAKRQLNKAIMLDPAACKARCFLARIYAKEGKITDATRLIDAILRIDPNYGPALKLQKLLKKAR
jgi:tetratricopeptide (TPR) repeat protein